MGGEKLSQDPLRTVVTEQTDVCCRTELTNSQETVKMKTETKSDCGYFSDSTDEMLLSHQRVAKEVLVESTNGQEVGEQTKNKLKLNKS